MNWTHVCMCLGSSEFTWLQFNQYDQFLYCPSISEALYRKCSFNYSFVMASIVKDKPLPKLRRWRKWHTNWYLFMITFVMKRWLCSNEWHYIVTALLDCPDCMMIYCSWKFTKIHQMRGWQFHENDSKFIKVHQNSWKVPQLSSYFTKKVHEISWTVQQDACVNLTSCIFMNIHERSWNFMNFHEFSWKLEGFFHQISWTFMKFHEFFQLGSNQITASTILPRKQWTVRKP